MILVLAATVTLLAVDPPLVVDAGRLPKPVVVDKVVAFVGSRPIALSEVELELRLERAAAGDVAGATGLVTTTELANLLPILVERTVVLRGMRSQYSGTLEPGIAEREVARMREGFSREAWDAFLVRLELTEEEVRERRRRVLEAGTILDLAVSDALTAIKREDLEAYLAEHPGMSREHAENALREAAEIVVRDDLLARKKKDLGAMIVDSIERGGVPTSPVEKAP